MTADLVACLAPIDPRLLGYLDEQGDLSVSCAGHLYRYSVAVLQGLVSPEEAKEDWKDFFPLAGAFVFSYGSERLCVSARSSTVLWVERPPGALDSEDRTLLVELVRELGAFLSSRKTATGEGIR